MNECHYEWCEYHHQYEPFCKLDLCARTERQLSNYERLLEIKNEQNKRAASQAGERPV